VRTGERDICPIQLQLRARVESSQSGSGVSRVGRRV
jgi:hypothetical protein